MNLGKSKWKYEDTRLHHVSQNQTKDRGIFLLTKPVKP